VKNDLLTDLKFWKYCFIKQF